jgi:hypothetical protein
MFEENDGTFWVNLVTSWTILGLSVYEASEIRKEVKIKNFICRISISHILELSYLK